MAMPGRYRCFWSSLPAMRTGPTGSRVSSSISAAAFEYLATSSMAMVRPRMPAPGPAQLGRKAQPQQVGVPEGLEDVRGVLAGGIDLTGPRLRPCPGPGGGRSAAGRRVRVTGRSPRGTRLPEWKRASPEAETPTAATDPTPGRRRGTTACHRSSTNRSRPYRGDDRPEFEQPCDRWITGFSSRAGRVAVLRAPIGPHRAAPGRSATPVAPGPRSRTVRPPTSLGRLPCHDSARPPATPSSGEFGPGPGHLSGLGGHRHRGWDRSGQGHRHRVRTAGSGGRHPESGSRPPGVRPAGGGGGRRHRLRHPVRYPGRRFHRRRPSTVSRRRSVPSTCWSTTRRGTSRCRPRT